MWFHHKIQHANFEDKGYLYMYMYFAFNLHSYKYRYMILKLNKPYDVKLIMTMINSYLT